MSQWYRYTEDDKCFAGVEKLRHIASQEKKLCLQKLERSRGAAGDLTLIGPSRPPLPATSPAAPAPASPVVGGPECCLKPRRFGMPTLQTPKRPPADTPARARICRSATSGEVATRALALRHTAPPALLHPWRATTIAHDDHCMARGGARRCPGRRRATAWRRRGVPPPAT